MTEPTGAPLRFIGDGDSVPDAELPDGLDDKDLLAIFRWLVLLRTFDERAVALQRQGRIGTYALYWGEEATQAGPMYACQEADWVFPTYRQNSIGILRGVAPSTVLAWWRGYGGELGFYNAREHRVAPVCVPIATHLPHAVGAAYAAKIRRDPVASLAWFGDGATSEGDWHEAMNFASVWQVPMVFFCVNNQWAISTPFTKQSATKTIVEKTAAYNMPGILVDGFDPIACWKATRDALERARNGGGPTLIEAFCYRIGAHGTADDPKLYRDEAEAQGWRALEPVSRTGDFLARTGILDDARRASIADEARDVISGAVSEMEAMQLPEREVLFDYVYASGRPPSFDEGVAELEAVRRPPDVQPPRPPADPSTGDAEAPQSL